MPIATGQFTIIDYNDALTLTGFIGSNHPKTQQYNPDNGQYSPSWDTASSPAGTNLVLTPSLFKLGSASDMISDAGIQSIQWYEVVSGVETVINGTTTNYTASAAGGKSPITLTVKKNILAGLTGKDFVCKIVYRDPTTNLDLTHKLGISFNRVVNGGGIADAVAWCPDGNIFKNGAVNTLKAAVDLWRGSVTDGTLVTYQWYVQDPAITSASGALYDAGAGAGWRKLSDVANSVTGTATREMTVYDSFVANYAVFKVQVKDTDSGSNTYNQFFYDTVTIVDQSDAMQITITSTGGDVFKNGVGSTTLTAKVFQAGSELDAAGTTYTYKWYKYNKDGVIDANFGGAGINYKSGKTLAVGDTDVDVKATFSVEIN